MLRRILVWLEVLTFCAAVSLAFAWIYTKNGDYEPYTYGCGVIAFGIELYRRYGLKDKDAGNGHGADDASSLLSWLLANAPMKDLSETLPVALRLAHKIGDKGFERWVRLEISGYNQHQMAEGDSVPVYRNVPGRYVNQYNQVAPFYPDIPALNVYRLWNGVRELERYSKSDAAMTIDDPELMSMIREQLRFDAVRFVSNPAAILSVLDAIRIQLQERLHGIEASIGAAKVELIDRNHAAGQRPESGQAKTASHEADATLDDVEIRLMKALTETSHLTPGRAAKMIGCKPAVAEHRLQRLQKSGFVRWDSIGSDGHDFHLTFEGRDWLHRHGHLE
jgi:hypothetical protein